VVADPGGRHGAGHAHRRRGRPVSALPGAWYVLGTMWPQAPAQAVSSVGKMDELHRTKIGRFNGLRGGDTCTRGPWGPHKEMVDSATYAAVRSMRSPSCGWAVTEDGGAS
jgi:hypothetical protein